MTSSNKKKRAKVATFKKAKLRVGKAATKPANFTSTAFKSKSIVLAAQSLGLTAPLPTSQFLHHLSLLTHHSATTRKDSLSFLTTHLPSSPVPPAVLIPALSPLFLDLSDPVRSQLLTLLPLLPATTTRLHMSLPLLHIWSAMSHIDPDIRGDSTRFLSWALRTAPEETMSVGGWGKGLGALSGVLGFAADAGPRGKKAGRLMLGHLATLKEFLEAGFGREAEERVAEGGRGGLHWTYETLGKRPGVGAYRYLGLFGGGDEGRGEDAEGRRRWCRESRVGREYMERLRRGLVGLTKEGGEIGRAAGRVLIVMEKGERGEVKEVCWLDRDGIEVV